MIKKSKVGEKSKKALKKGRQLDLALDMPSVDSPAGQAERLAEASRSLPVDASEAAKPGAVAGQDAIADNLAELSQASYAAASTSTPFELSGSLWAQATPAVTVMTDAGVGSSAATGATGAAGSAASAAAEATAATSAITGTAAATAATVQAGLIAAAAVGVGIATDFFSANTTSTSTPAVPPKDVTAKVDPVLTGPHTYVAGEKITFTLTFDENVTVTGSPSLAIKIGATVVQANYVTVLGSDPKILTFEYTVGADLLDTDGISLDANAFSLNGGSITNVSGQALHVLSAAVPAVTDIKVDSLAPELISNGSAIVWDGTAIDLADPTLTPNAQTVDLVFDEALNPDNLPDIAKFNVDGAAKFTLSAALAGNEIVSIDLQPDGHTLRLTMRDPWEGAPGIKYTAPTNPNDPDGIQDLFGNYVGNLKNGLAADGYLKNANVYVDLNNNGKVDATDYFAGKTDSAGNFFLKKGAPDGVIIVQGGINTDTGVANTLSLSAPADSFTINPLSTLVQSLVASNTSESSTPEQKAQAAAAAAQLVADNLGITLRPGESLLAYDPIASKNTDAQKAAAQVATIAVLANSASAGAGNEVISNLATTLANNTGDAIKLEDASVISNVLDKSLTGVASSASLAVKSAIADASASIAVAVETGGNDPKAVLAAISAAQSQALDKIAPLSPQLSAPNPTNDYYPIITVVFNTTNTDGTAAVPGDTVVLRDGSLQIGEPIKLTAAHIKAGKLEIGVKDGLSEGPHQLTAVLLDQAGNVSSNAKTLSLVIDTTAPPTPSVSTVAVDDVINLQESTAGVVVSGTAEPDSVVTVTWPGKVGSVVKTATAVGGLWSVKFAGSDLPSDSGNVIQGDVELSVTARDAAGNVSTATAYSIQVDTEGPAAKPTIEAVTSNAPGSSPAVKANDTTKDNTPTLSGTVKDLGDGETIQIFDGTALLGEAVLNQDKTAWSFTPTALTNAKHSMTAVVVDAAGNPGTASAAYAFAVDATVPTATVALSLPSSVGKLNANGVTTLAAPTDLKVVATVSGTLGPLDVIKFYDGLTLIEPTAVDKGTYTFSAKSLPDGAHTLRAVVESSGGNQGVMGKPLTFIVDNFAPNAPSVNAIAIDNQVNLAEKTAGITLSGTAEPGGTVTLNWEKETVTAVAGAGGQWSTTVAASKVPADGLTSLTAYVTDLAGNQSKDTTVSNILVDTQITKPVITSPWIDSAINIAALNDKGGLTLTGTADKGALITLSMGKSDALTIMGTVPANSDGQWSFSLSGNDLKSLGQGKDKIFSIEARDPVGNTAVVTTKTVTVDTLAPLMTAFSFTDSSDSGVKGDGLSNIDKPTLQFTAEQGAKLYIDVGKGYGVDVGDAQGAKVANATGSLQTLTLTDAVTNGITEIKLKAVDAAGNVTIRSGSYNFDGTAPTIVSVAVDESKTVGRQNDYLNAGDKLYFKVIASEPLVLKNSPQLNISLGGKTVTADYELPVSKLTADPKVLSFVYTIKAGDTDDNGVALPANALSLNGATLTDAAGNVLTLTSSVVSDNIAFKVDTTAPTTGIATVALSDDRGSSTSDFVTNIQKQTIRGTLGSVLATGESVQVSTDNGVNWTTATTNTGSADWSIADVQLSGSGTLQAKVVDLAGNSGPVKSQNYVVDLVKPAAPGVAEQGSNDLADGLMNTAESATTTFRVTLTGTGSAAPVANDSVELLLDGKSFLDKGKVTLTATNIANRYVDFVVAKSDLGEDGAKTLSARVTDVAGNGNDATVMPVGFTLDTTAPTTQVLNLGLSMDTGKLSNDFNTNVAAQTVGGTLTAPLAEGESVMVSTDSGVSWRKASLATFNSTSVGMTPGSGSSASTAGGGATAGDTQLFGLWKLENVTLSGNGTIQAKVVDLAGNDGPVKTQAYTLDTVAPTTTVATVQFSQDTGVSGDLITNVPVQTLSGTLSAALAAGESVMLSKDNGQSWVTASATVGSTAWSMADVTLSGKDTLKAKVVDTAGNDGAVTSKAYEIDTQSPAITGVTVTATGAKNSTLNEGDVITATVTTNEAMVVTGTPQVDLQIGSSTVQADYVKSASTSTALAFTYTVRAGQTDADGFSVPADAVKLNNGALTDTAGNALNLASSALAHNASYKVDAVAPRLTGSSANGKSIYLYYSEALSADSLPGADKFAVKVAGTAVAVTAVAPYQGDSSILQLTVANDLVRTQAVTVSYTQPASATAAIQDLAGNKAANLIDQTVLFAPAVTSIEYSTNDGTLKLGDSVDLTVTFTQAVTVTGSPILQLNTGGKATYVNSPSATQMLFRYTVGDKDTDVADLQTAATGLLLGDSTIKDSLGNDALYSSADSINPVGVLAVDKLSPKVTTVALTAATGVQNNTLNVGDTVTVTVTTSEPVVVSDTGGTGLQLKLLVGSDLVFANYNSTVGNTMLFKYTIQAEQTDADGISIPQNPLVLNDRTLADPAGNVMDTSASEVLAYASYKVDTTAPTTSIATVQLSNDTGSSASDFETNVSVQTISGTLSAALATGESVLVSKDNGQNWKTATANVGSLNWSMADVTLSGKDNLRVKVVDLAGNDGPEKTQGYTVDTIAPTTSIATVLLSNDSGVSGDFVTNVAAQTISGTLSANLAAGESVLVSKDNGANWTAASATVGSTAWSITGVTLSGTGTLKAKVVDTAGNEGAVNSKNYVIDAQAPTINGLNVTATGATNSTLNAGDVINITLTASEALVVTGAPQLDLTIGDTTVQAAYDANSSTATTLAFKYAVQAGQTDTDGFSIPANALKLSNGGALQDKAGNSLPLTSDAVPNNSSYKIDTTSPSVVSVALTSASGAQNNTLNAGDTVTATVAMSESVTVTGTPGLALKIGSTLVPAVYDSVNSTSTSLKFNYTISTGQNDTDGISVDANSLSAATGVTILDAAGNGATLTHSAVLNASAYLVDTQAPNAGTLGLKDYTDIGSSSSDRISNDKSFGLQWQSVDVDSQVAQFQQSFNNASWINISSDVLTNLADGTYKFRALISDAAGNTSLTSEIQTTVDTAPPSIGALSFTNLKDTGVSGDNKTADNNFSLSLSASEAGSTVKYQQSFNGGDWNDRSSGVFTDIAAGIYKFRAVATDLAGNTSTSNELSQEIFVNHAPTLSGLQSTSLVIGTGATSPFTLPSFSVADGDDDRLTLSFTTTNGSVSGLTDADATTPGIQLVGTAANINATLQALPSGTLSFTSSLTAPGTASLSLQLSDGIATLAAVTYDMQVKTVVKTALTSSTSLSAMDNLNVYEVDENTFQSTVNISNFEVGDQIKISNTAGSYSFNTQPDTGIELQLLIGLGYVNFTTPFNKFTAPDTVIFDVDSFKSVYGPNAVIFV